MRGLGPKLHPGLALGPRGGSCSSDTWVSPSGGGPGSHWDGHMPRTWGRDRGGPGGSQLLTALPGEAGGVGRSGLQPPACLSPHFRMGSGPAVQVTADNISARASISHWQSAFFPKERQK